MENIHLTNWCCYITDNPIKFNPGNDTILHKSSISTECGNSGYDIKSSCRECLKHGHDPDKNCSECLFGYNAKSSCTQCIENGLWDGEFVYSLTVYPIRFNITFYGPLCTQISGELHSVEMFFLKFLLDQGPFCTPGTLCFGQRMALHVGFQSQGGFIIACTLSLLVHNDFQSHLWLPETGIKPVSLNCAVSIPLYELGLVFSRNVQLA